MESTGAFQRIIVSVHRLKSLYSGSMTTAIASITGIYVALNILSESSDESEVMPRG